LNKKRFIGYLCWGLMLLPLQWSAAAEATPTGAQRTRYLAAERAFQTGDRARYLRLKSTLQDYPLYPYLEYAELKRNLHSAQDSEVRRFLEQYPDLPVTGSLRDTWLKQLARQGRWKSYLQFYQPGRSSEQQCNHLLALVKTGQAEAAFRQAPSLWLHGRSQPAACDALFTAWRKAGHLTPELIWQRIDLALQANQTRLADYLQGLLPTAQQKYFDRWMEMHRHPEQIAQTTSLKVPSPLAEKILLDGIVQLARKDSETARSNWYRISKLATFSPEQRQRAERTLALAMIREGHPNLLSYLDRIQPNPKDQTFLELRIRAALAHQDWNRVLLWVSALPEELRQEEGWRYWRARALEEKSDKFGATVLFRELAKERSYYGFLAADHLDEKYHFGHLPLTIDRAKQQQVELKPGIQRAREFYTLGRLTNARREWESTIRNLDRDSLQAVAALAHDWNWHERAIFALAHAKTWDDLELRFPLEHRADIDANAQQRQLDSAWVFAVIRQESAFMPDARSPAGALGLMQLMPGTARSVARGLQRQTPRSSDLLQPTTNIELGTAHLRQVMDQLDENRVLATAAYNAGIHRVRSWLPEQTMPADLWVETVPFSETRLYLKRVLTYAVIYQQRLGQKPGRLADNMPPIRPADTRTSSLDAQVRQNAG
jgi:soluble lytic murein transglycosylase